MPKQHTRSSSSNQQQPRYPNTMPTTLAPAAPVPIYNTRGGAMAMNTGYYTGPPVPSSAAAPMQPYETYAAAPVVSSSSSAQQPQTPQLPTRASSGAWTQQDDANLLAARQQGLNWAQIQSTYFPSKTGNACRKRHERLQERKGADDWDNRKLERMAREYMGMRKEIWGPLAARCGEKWAVVEAKCMANGLKNLQSAARAASRRDRLETGQAAAMHGYDDDSGISGIGLTPVDDLNDASYSSPETSSSHSGGDAGGGYSMHPMALQYGGYAGSSAGGLSSSYGSSSASYGHPHVPTHHHHHDASPYMGNGQRLPSVDMGIDAIINRPGGHHHQHQHH
ncbi:hypothetical protein F4780DRAFT_514612 [Xylariomycetidae sp. FL0641]|nr:hypothetical protein F4780DRAFT_514612 [Xylariomycetidae sp. FL0641]